MRSSGEGANAGEPKSLLQRMGLPAQQKKAEIVNGTVGLDNSKVSWLSGSLLSCQILTAALQCEPGIRKCRGYVATD